MDRPKKIFVQDYDPMWATEFEQIKKIYQHKLKKLFLDIQHVGSTSVVGLAAKPILDIDLVIEDIAFMPPLVSKLYDLGYQHIGDLGIKGREAFSRQSLETPETGTGKRWMKHNLYVCLQDAVSLRNHIAFRDFLRGNPESVMKYGKLKKQLAEKYPYDIDSYIEHKTPFILSVLHTMGFDESELEIITNQNKTS